MFCPFCRSRLKVHVFRFHTAIGCEATDCLVDEMSRYIMTYNNYPTYLISRVFIMNDSYIQVDYKNNITIISKLEACFLMDSIRLPGTLKINLKKPYDILPKIKLLMIFS